MKLKSVFIFVIFLITGINQSMAEEVKVNYVANFRYHHIHCNFMINGITIHSSLGPRPVMMSFSDRVGALLAEGDNTFAIEAMNIPMDPKEAYCEVILTAMVPNPEIGEYEFKEVASLRVTIDEEGNFTTRESQLYEGKSVTTNEISLVETDVKTFRQGVKNNTIATRGLKVNHPHKHFSWSYRSTPFEDTPENRELLWQKYDELREALASKDEEKYRSLLLPGSLETEAYQGDLNTLAFTNSMMGFVHEAWEASDFEVLSYNREDYDLQISAEDRMVRFVRTKSASNDDSPIKFLENSSIKVLNYTFTLIDGEIVVAY